MIEEVTVTRVLVHLANIISPSILGKNLELSEFILSFVCACTPAQIKCEIIIIRFADALSCFESGQVMLTLTLKLSKAKELTNFEIL